MIKQYIPLLLFLLSAVSLPLRAAALAPGELASGGAVLMDARTGQVLFDKQMDAKAYPASTTKIMTAILTIENCSPDEVVTVSESAVDIEEWDSANIGLIPGEQLTVRDALYALMLPSANDAANALAEHVAGSQERFAEMMTEKAAAIGAAGTRFANAHGLHEDMHYTTARDMALITRYASQNRDFMRYFGASEYTMPPTNLHPEERTFTNYQFMLVPGSEFYNPAVNGGKVGFTDEAMHTMSTVARKYGMNLVCVVMASPNRDARFHDTERMLNYGYREFHRVTLPASAFSGVSVPVREGGLTIGAVDFRSDSDFTALLRNDMNAGDIYIHYGFPPSFGPGDPLPTAAEVRIDLSDPTFPGLLGTHPLIPDLALEGAAVPAAGVSEPSEFSGAPLRYVGLSALVITAAALALRLGFLIKRRRDAERRRRERIAHMNRQIRRSYYSRAGGSRLSR